MRVDIILLKPGDEHILDRVARDVFDGAVDPALAREFVADRRHHIVVAIEDNVVVGMVTAVDYIHPDKKPQLWINEVGVAPTHQRRGRCTRTWAERRSRRVHRDPQRAIALRGPYAVG